MASEKFYKHILSEDVPTHAARPLWALTLRLEAPLSLVQFLTTCFVQVCVCVHTSIIDVGCFRHVITCHDLASWWCFQTKLLSSLAGSSSAHSIEVFCWCIMNDSDRVWVCAHVFSLCKYNLVFSRQVSHFKPAIMLISVSRYWQRLCLSVRAK